MKKGIVINLRGGKERTEALKSAYKAVAECSERLRELSVELALKGVWKEWSDSKPIGTEYSFTYEQMHQTGDREIDALVALVDNLEDYLDEHSRYKCKSKTKEPLRCESRVMSREEWQEHQPWLLVGACLLLYTRQVSLMQQSDNLQILLHRASFSLFLKDK